MKKFLALIMIFLMSSLAYGANLDSQIKTQQKNQNDMKKKIQQYNEIAKQKSRQSKDLLSQLSRLKQNANASQERMNDLERENDKLQNSVSVLDRNIAVVTESINILLTTLRNRLVDIYKFTPEENSLSVILNSEGPHEAINTAYMLRRFARHDIAMLQELAEKEQELTLAKSQLEKNKSQIAKQTDELKKKRAEFDSTIKKTDSLLKNVQSEQKKAEAAARELESAQKAVGNKINSLMKQKTTAAKKKTSTSTKAASSKAPVQGSKAAVPVKDTSTVSKNAPKNLSWPLNGTVTMQYGSRVHPTFKTKIFNSGIDIKAAAGTPVKAAGPGEVLYQGWLRGFGQVVIIDHGGNLTTVYAHLGGTSVREGANVQTGAVIGKVGNTGTDSEYGLHFEVRKNGSAQNPMNYLRR
ncbi:MAG: peptidoglycan DD-metalloendopeptidase family protein [Synergistaceae bacterium]|nr:peptidoglycan DD-metalloendopeptidase family protein [Synergistaceae bacterium]